MKKLFTALLAVLMLAACLTPVLAAQTETAFRPVLRFVASSDTHVKENDDTNALRIGKMMQLAYAEAEADPSYQRVDALLVAGDLTNDGTETEFDLFRDAVNGALRGDTKFLGVVAKNHDGYALPRAALRSGYTARMGCDPDFHTVINGYHFIGVSASSRDGKHYDSGQIRWLKEQLDAATAEDPARPVFVTHHEHVRGTVYGSSLYDGWGVTYFTSVLKKYPQVVDFSGHSHFPLNHPGSVWQGEFTAVGTGAITYSEFTVEGVRSYHPADSGDTATCWLVELNAAHDMRLRGFDVNEGKPLCELTLQNPADPANRDYTPEKREAAASAPAFEDDAALNLTPSFGAVTVKVPAARSTDGMPVVLYRVSAKTKLGATAAKSWVMPVYYRAVEQDTVELTLSPLAAGTYTVTVTAENAYGDASQPLQAAVTVEGETGIRAFFVRIAAWFGKIRSFFRQLFW